MNILDYKYMLTHSYSFFDQANVCTREKYNMFFQFQTHKMANQKHALEFMGNRWLYFKFLNKAICQKYGNMVI